MPGLECWPGGGAASGDSRSLSLSVLVFKVGLFTPSPRELTRARHALGAGLAQSGHSATCPASLDSDGKLR